MAEIDFLQCPSCKARTWEDLAALGDERDPFRFRCVRCGHLVKLAGCSRCRGNRWIRMKNLFEKDSKKPVVRYQCASCGRIIGIALD